jgi:DNA-binding LytR/AlgR family response regulator
MKKKTKKTKKKFLEFIPGDKEGSIIPIKLSGAISITLNDGEVCVDLDHGYFQIKKFNSLDAIMKKLDPCVFFRANRNAILHIGKISRISPSGRANYFITLVNGKEVGINAKKASLLRSMFGWE